MHGEALTGRTDVRVGGENLLGQRRAGARHADDKDRRGVGIGGTRIVMQPIAVEVARNRGDEVRIGFAGEGLQTGEQRVALAPMGEGGGAIACTYTHTGEVEMSDDAMLGQCRALGIGEFGDALQLVRASRVILGAEDDGKPRQAELGIAHGSAHGGKFGARFVVPAEHVKSGGALGMPMRQIASGGRRDGEQGEGIAGRALLQEEIGEVETGGDAIRRTHDYIPQPRDSIVLFAA